MLTTLLNGALKILTDFGAGEILILLFVVGYYEVRFKNMNKKQDETDYNVISLENSTLKNVDNVRVESQKRLDDIVEKLKTGKTDTDGLKEILLLFTQTMGEFFVGNKGHVIHTQSLFSVVKELTAMIGDVNDRVDHYERAYRKLKVMLDDLAEDRRRQVDWIEKHFVRRNLGTFGEGPAPANFGKSSEETTVEPIEVIVELLPEITRTPILSSIEPQEEVLEPSLVHIQAMEENTEFHDLNVKEMEADEPEKYEFLVPITEDEPNIIDVLEERQQEVSSFGALNTRDC